ncbi:uncharacterized protein LOC132206007 isoform X2 [Stegostoma tigrinum]|uniref:uncharacterized protein LOC132206007 isoform X2 n=1 Tax=Stegostoma tigrinum TaxID=3053191 RepID=UPI002870173C|nr:uncharacterized protein LOC132206007 isoform X2 [Stegostoma tigrinum]
MMWTLISLICLLHETVSVPVITFESSPDFKCTISASCESDSGSLKVLYAWYEKTSSQDSKISDTKKLDLHCRFFKQKHHQYYCSVSNIWGVIISETVDVSVIQNSERRCNYVAQTSSRRIEFNCEASPTMSPATSTTSSKTSRTSPTNSRTTLTTTTIAPTISTTDSTIFSRPVNASESCTAYDVVRWGLFAVMVIWAVSVTVYARKSKPLAEPNGHNMSKVGK